LKSESFIFLEIYDSLLGVQGGANDHA